MIRDKLVPAIERKFSEYAFKVGQPPDPVVHFPAPYPDIGSLDITDDGDEATIFIGDITHSHFNPYDGTLTQEEIDHQVTEEILDFLEDLFADRILLHKSSNGGGWVHLDRKNEPTRMKMDYQYFLWSRPL